MKLLVLLATFLALSANIMAATSLENATITPISLAGNDIVYNPAQNVLYMSVPSSAGFPYGNSIVTIDPATGQVIHSTFVGSEPDKLAISSDDSRVYIGVDGADSFCWWEPATDTVSALAPFTTPFGFAGPSVANEFAIDPADPQIVIVSKADVYSTADGDLEIFNNGSSVLDMDLGYGAESICFSDPTNLIGFNNVDSGYDLWNWSFDGTNLSQTKDVQRVVSGWKVAIKSADGRIFGSTGEVVAASTLQLLGTFSEIPYWPAVEPMPGTNIVYFLGSSNGVLQLTEFDRNTFLEFDAKLFTNAPASEVSSLVRAGKEPSGGDRLAFVQSDGSAGIIGIPPTVFKVRSFRSNGWTSQVTWASEIGSEYQLQWSDDLTNWTTFIITTATQFETTMSFNAIGGGGREFYRVVAK